MRLAGVVKERTVVELDDVRVAGAVMLEAGAVVPLLPAAARFPCPLRTLTGIPCPLCGMTTSVVSTLHLRLDDALVSAPAGVVAVVVAVVLVATWGRWRRVALPRWILPAVLGAMLLYQLYRFSTV